MLNDPRVNLFTSCEELNGVVSQIQCVQVNINRNLCSVKSGCGFCYGHHGGSPPLRQYDSEKDNTGLNKLINL